jgi:hypothetical protein
MNMNKRRYLTKSAFTTSLSCLTKLNYYNRKDEYENIDDENPFMQSLAKGGFQVGEMAKFLFCNDPFADDITIRELDYQTSLDKTAERMQQNQVVIAEAAFLFERLFVRVDLLVKNGNVIDLYEVKSKSYDREVRFLKDNLPQNDWKKYLYDVAFQKYVVVNALKEKGYIVNAWLVLVDKDTPINVNGLNQHFKLVERQGRSSVEVTPGLTRSALGTIPLAVLSMDNPTHSTNLDQADIINAVWNAPIETGTSRGQVNFKEYIQLAVQTYCDGVKIQTTLGGKCKDCTFRKSSLTSPLKSGFAECWNHHTGMVEEELQQGLIFDLWMGKSGPNLNYDSLIRQGVYTLQQVEDSHIQPSQSKAAEIGLTPYWRRKTQIDKYQQGDTSYYFDEEGLRAEMATWKYPLHMIDFETAQPAIPFHVGHYPYEGIAFQFSHHLLHEDGRVEHRTQFVSSQPGEFPNYEFARKLRDALNVYPGTIFRYSYHENTYLNKIHNQLENDPTPPQDKEELQRFIRQITHYKLEEDGKEKEYRGERCMVDLLDLVVKYYYSPHAGGSNSLKDILPAIIHDCAPLREKYMQPVYGKGCPVPSLNFDAHTWIVPEHNHDPYATLLPIIQAQAGDIWNQLPSDLRELKDGGAAMTAYDYLQFSTVPDTHRDVLIQALLRYCELDTLAMVMLVEGWRFLLNEQN